VTAVAIRHFEVDPDRVLTQTQDEGFNCLSTTHSIVPKYRRQYSMWFGVFPPYTPFTQICTWTRSKQWL